MRPVRLRIAHVERDPPFRLVVASCRAIGGGIIRAIQDPCLRRTRLGCRVNAVHIHRLCVASAKVIVNPQRQRGAVLVDQTAVVRTLPVKEVVVEQIGDDTSIYRTRRHRARAARRGEVSRQGDARLERTGRRRQEGVVRRGVEPDRSAVVKLRRNEVEPLVAVRVRHAETVHPAALGKIGD